MHKSNLCLFPSDQDKKHKFMPFFLQTRTKNINLSFKFYKKARQMKKAICSDNCAGYFLRKKFDPRLILVFPKLPQQKKGNLGNISQPQPVHFSASASKIRLRLQKTFPRFPFFYFGNLGKTKIRCGQIFPQSSQHNYQNKILFSEKTQKNELCHFSQEIYVIKFCRGRTQTCAREAKFVT